MKKMLEKFKKNKSSLVLIILALVLIIAGISFALFNPSINLLGRRNIKISKCELDINFKESDELMLVSKYPIKDSEALKYKAKDVVITNNSTCDTAYYKLTIKDLNNSSINKSKIKFQLVDKTSENTTNGSNPDTFLVEDSLTKGKSKSYSIRLWIDEGATNSDIYINGDPSKPKEYKFALNIESSDEEIKGPDYALEFAQAKVGTDGLEPITHTIDNTLQVDSKFATEYRYRGGDSTVNNYVTFNNEVWRIIGIIPTETINGNVENRIKIIRDTSIGNKKWNETTSNNWVTGTLNTYLNNDYYNTLTTDAKNMIGTAKYYLGGYSNINITTDVMWQYERKNDANRTGYYYETNPIMQNDVNKKIALMYASDYGYAASKECTSNLYDYDGASCKTTNNWLDKNAHTWLLPQVAGGSRNAFFVGSAGFVNTSSSVNTNDYAVRPVLSLSSNVKISGGKGTSEQPYQLSIS